MLRLEGHEEGPVLLVEPSDSIGVGAPGDGTQILRAMVTHGVPDAGVVINDPQTVETLGDTRPGQRHGVVIDGKSCEVAAEPLPLEVEVVSRSDGWFVPEKEPRSPIALMLDDEVDMGPCA